MAEKLSRHIFANVVQNAPLVSMDLVIQDWEGRILLGKRVNRPAKGFWFVPGGVIRKNEALHHAFERISTNELGAAFELSRAKFLGVYEHFYSDNFSGEDFGTHYVVLGYRLSVDKPLLSLPRDQHSGYRWFDTEELLAGEHVHTNTKAYFR